MLDLKNKSRNKTLKQMVLILLQKKKVQRVNHQNKNKRSQKKKSLKRFQILMFKS